MTLNRVVGSCIKVEVANCTGQHQKKGGFCTCILLFLWRWIEKHK